MIDELKELHGLVPIEKWRNACNETWNSNKNTHTDCYRSKVTRLHPAMVYPMSLKAGEYLPGLWGDSKSGYIHDNDWGKLKTQYHLNKFCEEETGWMEIIIEQVRKHYQMTQKLALTKTFNCGSSRIHFVQDIWSTRKTWEVPFTWTMLSTLHQWNAFSGRLSD